MLMIVAQLVLRGVWVSQSWFLLDDFRFLQDIALGKDDWEWYTRIHQGHFMPLSFLLVKIASLFGAFNWTAVAIQIMVLQAAASLTFWWMLRTIFGRSWRVLPFLAFYLFSALTMPSIMWWAVAINQLPHQIALCGALGAHVLYLRSGSWRHVALTTLFLCLGYATYAKTLLVPVLLVVMTLAWFGRGHGVQRALASLRDHLGAWLAYGAVTVVFIAGYVAAAPSTSASSLSALPPLTERTVLETFGTALVGGPWQWRLFGRGPISYTNTSDLLIVLAWLLIVATVVWLWVTRVRTLRALWLPGIYIAASIALVWSGRAFALGLLGGRQVAQHLQYISDAAPVIAVATGAMFLAIPGATGSSEPRTTPLVTVRLPHLLVGGIALAVLIGGIFSSSGYASPWSNDFVERAFTTNAINQIRQVKPVLADGIVPEDAFNPILAPENRIANYFAPLGDELDIRDVGTDLQVLNIRGDIVAADVDAGPRTRADPTKPCPIRVADKVKTIRFVPVLNVPLWMAIDYSATFSGDVVLTVAGEQRSVPIEQGEHRLLVATNGAYDRLQIRPLVEQAICVKSVRIGVLKNPDSP
ncbi:hypothetical protein ACHMWU_04315 [Aeromicrobium sp. UC242_57]